MLNPLKLGALAIASPGARLIVADFAIDVFLSVAPGVLTLLWGSPWQLVLGVYLILLGINYVPMLLYAVAISRARERSGRW